MVTLGISFNPERAHLRKPRRGVIAERVVPQSISGRYRRLKWIALTVCLSVYYVLPFLRWARGPGQPNQAVLFDVVRGRLYFFFIEIWPQEVYYLTGLLLLATLVLIWINAVAGRVWCGYFCPQTVWTDLFLLVERWIEGDRRERLKKRETGLSFKRVLEIGSKHAIWILIAIAMGGAFVLYFADAPTLLRDLLTGRASALAYTWVAILTGTTYAERGRRNEPPRRRIVRAKTVALGLSVAALLTLMGMSLSARGDAKITVLHDRNPVGVRLSDGRLRNGYTVRLYNKTDVERTFRLEVTGLPGASVEVVGESDIMSVAPETTRELRVLVSALAADRQAIAFVATDAATGGAVTTQDIFIPTGGH